MKRLNKNFCMITFLEMIITALKKILASASLINLTLLTLLRNEYYWMKTLKTIIPFGLNTKETYLEVYTITRFSSVLLV